MSPTLLPGLLAEIEDDWVGMGWPHRERLARGLARDATAERLASAGLPAPTEILEWFSWHDGVSGVGRTTFGPTAQVPLSLERALQQRERRIAGSLQLLHHDPDFPFLGDPDWWWDPKWLPIGSNGSTLVADLGTADDVALLRMVIWDDMGGPDEDPWTSGFRRVMAPSIAVGVQECRRLLATYAHWNNEDDRWDYDFRSVPVEDRLSFLGH
jgi:hypothetical protein